MSVAHLETTTGKTIIGLVDLDAEDMGSAFHALVSMLAQVSDPIVMTNDHVEIFKAMPETLRTRPSSTWVHGPLNSTIKRPSPRR